MSYNKYKAEKVYRGDRAFASKAEAALYDELCLRQRAGDISNLKCQVQVTLTDAKIIYKPDFQFEEKGEVKYAEFKGYETPEWRIKRKLWCYYGPATLYVYKGKAGHLVLYETIEPKDKKCA